mmetsp:Transcript_21340/g.26258  ORF Transcript_21340/g.26258 Transcript_21340/m.26258 type:complete len:101 (-) Transcript_21340:473-775(-)
MRVDWSKQPVEIIKRELMLALMDHPGLLFGWRDPTLRHSYMSDAKEYTDEYLMCLTQRLVWIATSNNLFRSRVLKSISDAVDKGNLEFAQFCQRQTLAVK